MNEFAPQHKAARRWLETILSGDETVGLPWMVLLAFLRLSTKRGLFPNPLSVQRAMDEVDAWLELEQVLMPQPGAEHAGHLRALLSQLGTGGDLTMGAHTAALALEFGAVVCTADRDFARFPGVRWRNPLGKAGSR